MNSEWKEVRLGEVTTSYNTQRVPLSSKQRQMRQGIYPYYGAQGIIDYIDDYIFEGEYLLVAEDGANLETRKMDISRLTGKLERFWVNNHAHILRANYKSDIRYIKYLLNKIDLTGYITGSAQPKLNKGNLESIKFYLPPINEQKSIAHILSTLEDKIETNNQINQRLEELAQTIFKHWFVDFEFPNENGKPYKSSGGEMIESELGMIPKGWEVGKFEDLVTVRYGKDHKKLEDGHIPVFGSGGVMRYVNESLYSLESVLIPRKGTLNNVIYINEPFWSIDTMFFTQMNYPNITKYIYFFIKYKDLMSMNSGSAVPSMTTNILNRLPIIVSPLTLIQVFNKLVEPIFLHMSLNDKQTRELSNLRDTLLPKLMSGELRVPLEGDDIQ